MTNTKIDQQKEALGKASGSKTDTCHLRLVSTAVFEICRSSFLPTVLPHLDFVSW